MAATSSDGGFRLPIPIISGLVLYVITSAFSGVWFASNVSTRLAVLEANSTNLPTRVSILENKMGDVLTVLREIRDDLKSRK